MMTREGVLVYGIYLCQRQRVWGCVCLWNCLVLVLKTLLDLKKFVTMVWLCVTVIHNAARTKDIVQYIRQQRLAVCGEARHAGRRAAPRARLGGLHVEQQGFWQLCKNNAFNNTDSYFKKVIKRTTKIALSSELHRYTKFKFNRRTGSGSKFSCKILSTQVFFFAQKNPR